MQRNVMAELLDGFVTLFRGRADCYGSWEGGCIRQPLTHETFRRHLTVGPHIGVYPAVHYNGASHVAWGCTDIDYDNYDEARRLQDAFAAVDVTAWTERTRKGWHIWVFADTLVTAKAMRHMFLACHQVARSNPKEVNPKQADLSANQVGNYVRLPYPMGDGADVRYIVDGDRRLALDEFVERALAHRVTADTVTHLAGYYIEPTRHINTTSPATNDMTLATALLNPLGWTIFRDGPLEGRDRSTTLTHLAHECAKSGVAHADALMLLEDADSRWGKYLMRGEKGRAELAKLVDRAYGATLST